MSFMDKVRAASQRLIGLRTTFLKKHAMCEPWKEYHGKIWKKYCYKSLHTGVAGLPDVEVVVTPKWGSIPRKDRYFSPAPEAYKGKRPASYKATMHLSPGGYREVGVFTSLKAAKDAADVASRALQGG
jgi:hypothetical protein